MSTGTLPTATSPDTIMEFSPESDLRRPFHLIQRMTRDLMGARTLAWQLFLRDLKAEYRQSLLGYVWLIAIPTITTMIWVFLQSRGIFVRPDLAYPAALFVFVGTLLWDSFTNAIDTGHRIFDRSRTMLLRVRFPPESLLLAGLARCLFNATIRMALLVAVLSIFTYVPPWTIVFMPLAILVTILYGFVWGLLLVPIGALFQDVGHMLQMGLMLLFLISPIVWTDPETDKWMAWVNPPACLVMSGRDLALVGHLEHPEAYATVIVGTLLLGVVTWVLLRLCIPHLIARVGA